MANDELHRSWQQAIELKKAQNSYTEPAYDYAVAGASSLLYFEGEKNNKVENRKKRMDINATLDKQMEEKDSRRQGELDAKRDERYLLDAISQIRQEADDEEERFRHHTRMDCKDTNLHLMKTTRESYAAARAKSKQPDQIYPNLAEV